MALASLCWVWAALAPWARWDDGKAARAPTPAPAPDATNLWPHELGLTPAEWRIFELLLPGSIDADIAAALHTTRHTIKYHVRKLSCVDGQGAGLIFPLDTDRETQ